MPLDFIPPSPPAGCFMCEYAGSKANISSQRGKSLHEKREISHRRKKKSIENCVFCIFKISPPISPLITSHLATDKFSIWWKTFLSPYAKIREIAFCLSLHIFLLHHHHRQDESIYFHMSSSTFYFFLNFLSLIFVRLIGRSCYS